jgi:hypothetical protein
MKFKSFLFSGPMQFVVLGGVVFAYAAQGTGSAVENFILGLVLTALILIPSLVAYHRNHHQRLAIFVLNVSTFWTGLGWVACLVWACSRVIPTTTAQEI